MCKYGSSKRLNLESKNKCHALCKTQHIVGYPYFTLHHLQIFFLQKIQKLLGLYSFIHCNVDASY